MGNLQLSGSYRGAAIEQYVDVDRAWSIRRTGALAAQRDLDLLSSREQHHWKERRLRLYHRVQKLTLLLHINRLGFINRRDTFDDQIGRVEAIDRPLQHL